MGMCPGQAQHPGIGETSLQVWLTSTLSIYLEEVNFRRPRSKWFQIHFSSPLMFPLFPFTYASTSSLTPGGRELFIYIYLILFVLFICCPIRFVFFSLTLHKPCLLFHSFYVSTCRMRPLLLHLCKYRVKMDKDLNGRPETLKQPEGTWGSA